MQNIEIPYFDNTLPDISGRMLKETFLQGSRNILYDDGKVFTRYGLDKLKDTMPDGNDVIRITLYKQLYNDEVYIVAMTKDNIFFLDPILKVWKYITRNFNSGTIGNNNISGLSLTYVSPVSNVSKTIGTPNTSNMEWTITLSDVANLQVGMTILSGSGIVMSPATRILKIDSTYNTVYLSQPTSAIPSGTITFNFALDIDWDSDTVEIGFGSNDINAITTWFPVDDIFSQTVLTLRDAQAIPDGTSFVIKRKYSGGVDNIWHTAFPYDDSMYGGGDKLLVATNGIDRLQSWKGYQNGVLTYCQDVDQYPNVCKHIGFWGSSGNEHLICSNVIDASGAKNSSAIELSDAGELSWEDGIVYPLYDTSSPILGTVPLQSSFVIYKQNTLSIADPTGDNGNPLNIKQDMKRNIGTISIDTVMDTGQFHLFFTGERIAYFDGFNHGFVDDGVNAYIKGLLNRKFASRSFAFLILDKNMYCLAIPTGTSELPNMIIVFNYVDKSFTFWDFRNGSEVLSFISKGEYVNKYIPSWAEMIIDETDAGVSLEGDLDTAGVVTFNGDVDLSNVLGARIIFSGTPDDEFYIKTIVDSTHAIIGTQNGKTTITTDDIATVTGETRISQSVMIGYTWNQLKGRWLDFSFSGDYNESILLGDTAGNIYHIGDFIEFDRTDVDTPIESYIETKDYELNKGLTTLHREITLRIERMPDSSGGFFTGGVYVSVSVDYGYVWSDEQYLPLDGLETFMEKKLAIHMRGKAIRFKVRATTPFILENCFIGFNLEGKSFKYDR